jgi:hypothetical protein
MGGAVFQIWQRGGFPTCALPHRRPLQGGRVPWWPSALITLCGCVCVCACTWRSHDCTGARAQVCVCVFPVVGGSLALPALCTQQPPPLLPCRGAPPSPLSLPLSRWVTSTLTLRSAAGLRLQACTPGAQLQRVGLAVCSHGPAACHPNCHPPHARLPVPSSHPPHQRAPACRLYLCTWV